MRYEAQVRCIGPKEDNIYTVGAGSLQYPMMPIKDYTQIGLFRNIGQQACQEPSPCFRALAFNNSKHEWINLVVTICCNCYQQLSFVLAIECITSMLITDLQCMNPLIHELKAQNAKLNI